MEPEEGDPLASRHTDRCARDHRIDCWRGRAWRRDRRADLGRTTDLQEVQQTEP